MLRSQGAAGASCKKKAAPCPGITGGQPPGVAALTCAHQVGLTPLPRTALAVTARDRLIPFARQSFRNGTREV